MAEAASSDLVFEFDLVSEELFELLDAGLPKGRSEPDERCPEGWDSKQIVAHIAELCEFWRNETEECLRRPRNTVIGRSNFDEERLRRVNTLSLLSTSELIDRVTLEVGKSAGLLSALEAQDLAASATHLTDGQITISELISKDLIAHISEHLAQLKELEELSPYS